MDRRLLRPFGCFPWARSARTLISICAQHDGGRPRELTRDVLCALLVSRGEGEEKNHIPPWFELAIAGMSHEWHLMDQEATGETGPRLRLCPPPSPPSPCPPPPSSFPHPRPTHLYFTEWLVRLNNVWMSGVVVFISQRGVRHTTQHGVIVTQWLVTPSSISVGSAG